jgi:hypothetical protein
MVGDISSDDIDRFLMLAKKGRNAVERSLAEEIKRFSDRALDNEN